MNTLLTLLFVLNEISRLSGSLMPLLVCASLFMALLVMLIFALKGMFNE
ncbi:MULTISPECIES: hypothetical protein [Erwinia]|nr:MULTISPECIES: hypothetical protein [Erwinia]MBD8165418.1 hypothetical protein [Erwinia persicina]MBP2157436.1 hypothetical protein [Erwinia rhapontici]